MNIAYTGTLGIPIKSEDILLTKYACVSSSDRLSIMTSE